MGTAGEGGGIYSAAKLIVTGSTFSSNTGGTGGTGTSGGAIFTKGTATVISSTFTRNTAGVGYLGPPGNGGAIANTGTLTLSDSTMTLNHAGSGAAQSGEPGGNGGGLYSGAARQPWPETHLARIRAETVVRGLSSIQAEHLVVPAVTVAASTRQRF